MKVKISQLKTLFYIQLAVVVLVSYDCFAASSSEEGDVYPHSFVGAHVEYANPSTSRMPDQSALGVLIGSQFTENWSWDIANTYIEVVAHADSWRADLYNEKFSLNRAQTVSDQFEERRGIVRERITEKGMGEISPIVDNRTSDNGALNRRVDIDMPPFTYED
ncbi:OmpA family protein [Vibrio lentus]|uniref:OmpA family protein n=1 Tax=Vibrio lentus TaxID=136468 RepID=UPI003D131247